MPQLIIILIAALITACISGIFGMAGGMIFMAVILTFMSVQSAMIVHGAVQSVSNSHRAYLLRTNIRWDIIGYTLLGALPVIIVLYFLAYAPQKRWVYALLGALPFLLWLPRGWMQGDAEKPVHAVFCGALVIALNIAAGVAGPALDFFYVKTGLTRQEIVSTKAVTMIGSHFVKIGYYGLPMLAMGGPNDLPPVWVFVAAIPCVMVGTLVGTRVLHRLDDVNFKSYTKYLVTLIGIYYLSKAAGLI